MTTAPTASNRRWRNIALGGASAFAAKLVAVICGFVQVPLALQFLGAEGFGVWVTLQAFAGLSLILDFGTGYHLQNIASATNIHGRFGEIEPLLRSAFWIAVTTALLLALTACCLDSNAWPGLAGMQDAELRAALGRWLGPLLAVGAIGIPFALGQRLATGVQQSWLVGSIQAVTSFLTLLAVLICAAGKTPAVVFLAVTLAVPVGVNAMLFLWMMHRLGLGWSFLRPPSAGGWLAGLRGGSLFFVTQTSAALRQAVPPFIIATTLGPAAVTSFNLVQRLLTLLVQPQLWVMEPLWAAYTDAHLRGDFAWIRRVLRLTYFATIAVTILPLAVSVAWGASFLEWWTRHPARDFPTGLLGWMAAWFAITALIQPISYLLNSMGWMKGQVAYGTITTIVGLSAMVPACRYGGLSLAFLPFTLVVAGLNLPCAIADLRRAMRSWIETPGSVTT